VFIRIPRWPDGQLPSRITDVVRDGTLPLYGQAAP
jgi:hypothetical protein